MLDSILSYDIRILLKLYFCRVLRFCRQECNIVMDIIACYM